MTFTPQLGVEVLASLLGVLSVWLLSRGDGRGWPVGTLMVVFSGWLYWSERIYGQAALNVFFFVMQAVGWWRWARGEQKDMRVSSRLMSRPERAILLAGWLLASAALSLVLTARGGEQVLADAFATVGSLLGQALIVAGFAECWLAYLAVDLVLVVVSAKAELYFYLTMYLVYCGLAWNGWKEWTRDPRAQRRTSSALTED